MRWCDPEKPIRRPGDQMSTAPCDALLVLPLRVVQIRWAYVDAAQIVVERS